MYIRADCTDYMYYEEESKEPVEIHIVPLLTLQGNSCCRTFILDNHLAFVTASAILDLICWKFCLWTICYMHTFVVLSLYLNSTSIFLGYMVLILIGCVFINWFCKFISLVLFAENLNCVCILTYLNWYILFSILVKLLLEVLHIFSQCMDVRDCTTCNPWVDLLCYRSVFSFVGFCEPLLVDLQDCLVVSLYISMQVNVDAD